MGPRQLYTNIQDRRPQHTYFADSATIPVTSVTSVDSTGQGPTSVDNLNRDWDKEEMAEPELRWERPQFKAISTIRSIWLDFV